MGAGWLRPLRISSSVLLALACLGLAANVAATVLGPHHPTTWRDAWLYDGTILAASLSALAATRSHRAAEPGRTVIAVGMVLWSLGDIVWEIYAHNAKTIPTPSAGDALDLAMYPLMYIGLLLVTRARLGRVRPSVRIDGLVVGLGAASVYSFIFTPVVRTVSGGTAAVVTEMAYPVGDLLLAVVVVGLLASLGWNLDRFLAFFAIGCVLFCVADSHYLLASAAGHYHEGTLFDCGWTSGLVLWSVALRQPQPHASQESSKALSALLTPGALAITSAAVLLAATRVRIPLHVAVLAALAVVAGMVRTAMTFHEVAATAQARRLALTDDATGLGNRRALSQRIRATIAQPGAEAHLLIVLGLNRYRELANAFGHRQADQLMLDVSRRLAGITRETETLVRFGEHEFALWVPAGHQDPSGRSLAERLLFALAVPFPIDAVQVTVRAHIGIARFPDQATTEVDLLRVADMAMMRARNSGADSAVCDVADPDAKRDQILLTEHIRAAVRSDALVCHYQPKVDASNGTVVGAEALVRWRQADGSILGPDHFLPVAREAGLLSEVTRQVVTVAVEQASAWRREGVPVRMSVNLSIPDLLDTGITTFVARLLERTGLPSDLLMVEVTEETFMTEPEQVHDALVTLHDLGVGVSIDDFGSGYSSLAYLRTVPAEELKIDREFVSGISTSRVDQSIVAAIVSLADSLGIGVVAEGVESQDDVAMLVSLGCPAVQGYAISPPVDAERFRRWLADGASPVVPIGASAPHAVASEERPSPTPRRLGPPT